jgi:hypothetical protein
MAEKRVATKPQPRRVPSDDCEVSISGEKYYPHVGESLWVVGRPRLGEQKAQWAFLRISAELDEVTADPRAEGEADEAYRARVRESNEAQINVVEGHYDQLISWFAARINRWDWTDDKGDQLPPLDGTTKPFLSLTMDEVFYIKDVLLGEGPAEALNEETTSQGS